MVRISASAHSCQVPTPRIGKHVVFGRVIRGFEIVERIVQVPTDEKDRPRAPVVISNCGELMLRAPAQPKKPERTFCSLTLLYDARF